MSRDLVFNPLSIAAHIKYDPTVAQNWVDNLLRLFQMAQQELGIKYIRMGFGPDGKSDFWNVMVMENYPFSQLLADHVPQPKKLLFLTWTVNRRYVHIPAYIGLKNLEDIVDKRYCFDHKSWGLVFFRDYILISIASSDDWDKEIVDCEYIDLERDVVVLAYIRHATTYSQLHSHKRIYHCHPKHCYHLPYDGQRGTRMDLDDTEAQSVLNGAVKVHTHKQLYGYSKRTQKLYEFMPESPGHSRPNLGPQNVYHGYPIAPEEIHRDIGGTAYEEIITTLIGSGDIDDIAAKRFQLH